MEFLEGEALSDAVARGTLTLDEVEAIGSADVPGARRSARQGDRPPRSQARQHYLVPARGGRRFVKILDFGIAKFRRRRARSR